MTKRPADVEGTQVEKASRARALSESLDNVSEPPRKLGIALIGLGRAGSFHLESLKVLPELTKLIWAIDVDAKRAQEVATKFDSKWAATPDEALLDPKVDAVIIASATDTHFPFIMKTLKAGKACFAEKPISHDVKEVEEAVSLAKSKNLPFICAFQRRVDKNFRELKRLLDDGAVGGLKVVKSCSRDNPVPPLEYLRTSGGIFHDMLVHDFDMLDFLSQGQVPESVTSYGHCYNKDIAAFNDLDTVAVMFKYSSGLIAMVDTCRDAAYGYDQRVEAFGEKGMLTAKNEMTTSVELATVEGHLMPPAMWSFPQRYNKAYLTEMVEFVAMLQAGTSSDLHLIEQRAMERHPRVVRTTIAAELSWKLGRTVFLKDIDKLMAEHPSH